MTGLQRTDCCPACPDSFCTSSRPVPVGPTWSGAVAPRQPWLWLMLPACRIPLPVLRPPPRPRRGTRLSTKTHRAKRQRATPSLPLRAWGNLRASRRIGKPRGQHDGAALPRATSSFRAWWWRLESQPTRALVSCRWERRTRRSFKTGTSIP